MQSGSQSPQSLSDLQGIHQELEALFYLHQVALLKSDYSSAKALLKEYEENLLMHMKEEEDILLPLYRDRAEPVRGGDAETFTGEHKKIVEWLNRLRLRLFRVTPVSPDLRAVIALWDDEASFKKCVEHHALREDRIFYPEIERLVTEEEKKHLLRLMTFNLEQKPVVRP